MVIASQVQVLKKLKMKPESISRTCVPEPGPWPGSLLPYRSKQPSFPWVSLHIVLQLLSSILHARRNPQTQAVCRDPLRDQCRKRRGKDIRERASRMSSGHQGPSRRSCVHVLAALGPQVLTFCPPCVRKGLDLQGEQRINSECPRPSAAALLLSLPSSADGSCKDACWCLGRVLICSIVPFISLLNGSLSQTWDWGEKNQSSKMPKLFRKTFQMKVVRQKRVWNGFDYLISTIWRMI